MSRRHLRLVAEVNSAALFFGFLMGAGTMMTIFGFGAMATVAFLVIPAFAGIAGAINLWWWLRPGSDE